MGGNTALLRNLARGFSLLLVGAVLAPLIENWRKQPHDDFPLSYYPMFSARRSKRINVYYLVGIDADGKQVRLPYRLAGAGGFNQVRRQINRMARNGSGEVLCEQVARRLAKRSEQPFGTMSEVQLVVGTFRLNDYFAGEKAPAREKILARYALTEVLV
jgi:hypothetical protein